MEFGVSVGTSLRKIAASVDPRVVYGFDCFTGLPEDWSNEANIVRHSRGTFAGRIVNPPSNTVLIEGLFQETLPQFLEHNSAPIAFVHMDADLYSSTKFVLDCLATRLAGAIVAFDELKGDPCFDWHEGRAWKEFTSERQVIHLGDQHECGGVFQVV
jgi:hypothetical protein